MIKVEGSLCVCVSTRINWNAFSKKALLLSPNTPPSAHWRCIRFQKHLLFPPACLWLCHVLCTFPLTLCMCSPGWQQKYDNVEKRMSPSETIRAPGMESDQKCSITPISFPRWDIPPLHFPWKTLFCFPPSNFFLFFFIPFPLPLRASLHSLAIIHLKLMSVHFCKCRARFSERKSHFFHKYAHRYRNESTLMNASLLHCPIFSYSSQRVKCRGAATLVIHDTSSTQAVHPKSKGGEWGGEGRREERGRGGEQDTPVKRLESAEGWDIGLISEQRQQRSPRLKAGERWWWAGGNHGSGTQLYWFKISQTSSKRHTSKAVFLSEKEINTSSINICSMVPKSTNFQVNFVNLNA